MHTGKPKLLCPMGVSDLSLSGSTKGFRSEQFAVSCTSNLITCNGIRTSFERDIISIDVAKKTSVTDHMVFASGTSNRHINSMSESIHTKLKKLDIKDSRMEGKNSGWVIIDSGDVIVHLFKIESRKFYNLEKMWSAEIE